MSNFTDIETNVFSTNTTGNGKGTASARSNWIMKRKPKFTLDPFTHPARMFFGSSPHTNSSPPPPPRASVICTFGTAAFLLNSGSISAKVRVTWGANIYQRTHSVTLTASDSIPQQLRIRNHITSIRTNPLTSL